MTIDEIYNELSNHMLKGIMLHEQQSDYYDFLNLHGYKRMSEYHAKCEMKKYRKIHRYYINHYNKLIEEDSYDNPNVIPNSWYKYSRQEVDANTKRSAVKTGIEKWVSWEKETKKFYENLYKEAMELGEVAAANKINCLICEVDRELKWATRKHLDLLAADYDLSYIMGQQDHLHDWYKKRMKKYDKS